MLSAVIGGPDDHRTIDEGYRYTRARCPGDDHQPRAPGGTSCCRRSAVPAGLRRPAGRAGGAAGRRAARSPCPDDDRSAARRSASSAGRPTPPSVTVGSIPSASSTVTRPLHEASSALRAAGAMPETALGLVDQLNVSDGGVPKRPVETVERRRAGRGRGPPGRAPAPRASVAGRVPVVGRGDRRPGRGRPPHRLRGLR